jgi:hypothetical protein
MGSMFSKSTPPTPPPVPKLVARNKDSDNESGYEIENFENVIFNNNVICAITIAVILVVLYLKFGMKK